MDELSSKAQTIINKYLDRNGDAKGRYSAFCAATGVVPWGLLDSDDYDALLEVRPATSWHSFTPGSMGPSAPFLLHMNEDCEKKKKDALSMSRGVVCCTPLPDKKAVKLSQGKGQPALKSPLSRSQLGFLTLRSVELKCSEDPGRPQIHFRTIVVQMTMLSRPGLSLTLLPEDLCKLTSRMSTAQQLCTRPSHCASCDGSEIYDGTMALTVQQHRQLSQHAL